MKNLNIRRPQRGAIQLGDFLKTTLPVDNELLGRMILEKSIGLIAGPRGGGKSWCAMIFAYAIAAEKPVSPWGTGSGVAVAYLDGEMRATGVQERFSLLHARNLDEQSRNLANENIFLISRDYVGDPIGSLDTEEGQVKIDELIPAAVKLIIIDNLSAWTSGGREDSNSWATIKNWLIKKRLQGIAVLLIHHTGKNGQQRGTSMHEDLLDYSILLSPLPSVDSGNDTRFGIEHTKLRDHIPELRQKYECTIWVDEKKLKFEFTQAGLTFSQDDIKILKMHEDGKTQVEIAAELSINKSTVSRKLKAMSERATAVDV